MISTISLPLFVLRKLSIEHRTEMRDAMVDNPHYYVYDGVEWVTIFVKSDE